MKFKIRKRWVAVLLLLVLISPFLLTSTMSEKDHQKLSEFRLAPILKTGTSVHEMRSYLDRWGYKYYLMFRNYCEEAEGKIFFISRYNGEYDNSECYKVYQIALHGDTWFTLMDGSVIYQIKFDKNQKLDSFSNRVAWTFF